MNRHIAFDGIDNFRDFGGYAAGTHRVKRGLLFRSGHHAKASDSDLARLEGLGLQVIVDLRRRLERETDPSRRVSDGTVQIVETDVDGDAPIEWPDFIERSDLSAGSFRNEMRVFYETALFMPRHIDIFSRYFRSLASTRSALLVHCAAGKDRTGLICALTHHLLGVHRDDIVADYLLTNQPERIEARIPVVQETIFRHTGRRPTIGAARVAITVFPEYLESAFESMRIACGSTDEYLERSIGVDAALRERLRARLLE